jgi:hypothetical protein
VGATENGVFALAREAGIELEAGTALPWLSNRGHLNPILVGVVPETMLAILSSIHQRLGGDEDALAGKRAGSSPRPDFLLPSATLVVEVDEIQHFTSDRLLTLELYPKNAQLAFDVAEYRALIGKWATVADRYRAAKPAIDFPPRRAPRPTRVLRCGPRAGRALIRLAGPARSSS